MWKLCNYEAVIVGGGQAGIAMGYHLKMNNLSFVILEGNERVGDSWRKRYNSLKLFTPYRYSSLPGLEMKGASNEYPTKDDMADYLEDYVQYFKIPVMCNTKVSKLDQQMDGSFLLQTNNEEIRTQQVIIATGAFQKPNIPNVFDQELDVFHIHSSEYRSPSQVPGSDVLVVGGGNSGGQIAVELAKDRKVTIATGHRITFLPLTLFGRSVFSWLELSGLLHAGIDTLKGRWFKNLKDPIFGNELKGLIKNKKVYVKPKVIEVNNSEVIFEDHSRLKFDSIIWSTGFVPSYDWIKIKEVISTDGKPIHTRGRTNSEGLFFIGLPWQYQRGSGLICGVSKDAEYLIPIILSNRNNNYLKIKK